MKKAVGIAKVIQTGAGAGLVLAPMFMGKYRQQEQQLVDTLTLVCLALVLSCLLFLWAHGEKKRAWKGLVATIVLAVIVSLLSAPMVIR